MRTDSSPGTLPAREHLPAGDAGTPVLDVVIPVYNEEKDLQPCVRRLHEHLARTFPYAFRITIADNASTDTTPQVAARLEAEIPEVTNFRLEQKGRGRALRTVWSASDAPVLAYMDVDLSTDLNALLPLVAPLISGHSDLAIGSRLARSSRVVRGPKREFISRAYNLILRGSLQARFSDAQCGFKAIRRDVAQVLLPLVEDTGWFFDTEMLVLAERAGLRIHEVPVDWVDDPDSTVHIVKTATEDLKGVWRVGKALATGSLPLDRIRTPKLDLDHHFVGGPDDTVAYVLTLDAVNFGSGWFEELGTSTDALTARLTAHARARGGTWTAEEIRGGVDVAAVLGLPADHELTRLYAQALRQLGSFLGGRGALDVVAAAGGSAQRLARRLADGMPFFADHGFYKRAQITANDLALAGVAEFADVDRLTVFADNLLPHVLRVEGVLHYAPELAERVDAGVELPAGSEMERELRACTVHACEGIATRLGVPPRTLDNWLWNRGRDLPGRPHRTRTVFY
jgi:hypothetical protein